MRKERAGSLIFFFVGIYGLIFTLLLPLGKWNEPGPGVFPLFLSILLSISGILWFIYGKQRGEGEAKMDWRGIARKLNTPLRIIGVTAAFVLTLDWVGYLVTSSLYLFILFLWVSRYRIWVAMGLAIILGAGSWYFFEKILAVQLPKGFWTF